MTKKLIKKKRISQNQSVNQVVNIVIGDVVKKKKRKKIKKKQASPKPDILGRTQPYQIPLYMPAFPQRIHTQTTSDQTKVSNLLRNYMAVNNAEIKRLKGDLGAYRIQEQSGKAIAYPKNKVSIESVEDDDFTDEIEDDMNQSAEIEYQDGIRLAPTLSEYTESEVDNRPDSPSDSPSDTEVEIRPDSPSDSPNDTEDDWREKLAMRPSSPIPTPPQSDDGYKTAVSESPQAEVSLPPRRGTRKNKNMAELRRELESLGVYARSNTPRAGLVELAEENSISILR
tara:strand:- start:778 stop:1629 length:852 start_codon:yes stop_codon:yes gene_type:complete